MLNENPKTEIQKLENEIAKLIQKLGKLRKGKKIYRKNAAQFGPGDLYCPHWHILSLAGIGEGEWTVQFNYWKRPAKLDDGGQGAE